MNLSVKISSQTSNISKLKNTENFLKYEEAIIFTLVDFGVIDIIQLL